MLHDTWHFQKGFFKHCFALFLNVFFCLCYSAGGIPARNTRGERLLLYIGIIDILQSYRLQKKLEHVMKAMVHDGVSCFTSSLTLSFKKSTRAIKDPGKVETGAIRASYPYRLGSRTCRPGRHVEHLSLHNHGCLRVQAPRRLSKDRV